MELSSAQSLLQHHICLVALGLLADLIFGDPVYRWHPIRLLGGLLQFFEHHLRLRGLNGRFGGFLLFVCLFAVASLIYGGVHFLLSQIHWSLALIWDVYLGFSMIAFKDLCVHGLNVGRASLGDDIDKTREEISKLVGRDTAKMDAHGCNRAAVESMSESLVDGVLSPLFYYILFGPYGVLLFKVASTMDSMVGYKNEKYIKFGWFGARLDDVLNYIPSRLSWLFISFVSGVLPGFSGKKAFQVGCEQYHHLPGPNAGWSEASAAGALGIKLVGPIWRNNELTTTLWIGDPGDPEGATLDDIKRMIVLNLAVTLLFFACFTVLYLILPAG